MSDARTGACGTYAAAMAHKKRHEPMDPACLRAVADYKAWWRFRTGRQTEVPRCHACGSVFRQHNCHAYALRAGSAE